MMNVSVVIRTFNPGSKLEEVLKTIRNQSNVSLNEVIIVDSGSRDATLDIAQAYDCKIIRIDPKEFSFGRALNLGAQASISDVIVFLSPDCLPTSNKWLFCLTSPLIQEDVAAVFGRQIPFKGVNPYEEVILKDSFPPRAKSDGSSPAGKYAFSNANCAIKRKFLTEAPFDESIVAGEEWSIVNYILINRYRIVYEPRAAVYHSHTIERLYLKAHIYSYGLRQATRGPYFDNIGYLITSFLFWLLKDMVYFIRIHNASALFRAPIHEFVRHFYLWKGSSDCRLNRPLYFDPRLYRRFAPTIWKVASLHP